jgi:hypothetical protein
MTQIAVYLSQFCLEDVISFLNLQLTQLRNYRLHLSFKILQ